MSSISNRCRSRAFNLSKCLFAEGSLKRWLVDSVPQYDTVAGDDANNEEEDGGPVAACGCGGGGGGLLKGKCVNTHGVAEEGDDAVGGGVRGGDVVYAAAAVGGGGKWIGRSN